jgi:hypothetical protein
VGIPDKQIKAKSEAALLYDLPRGTEPNGAGSIAAATEPDSRVTGSCRD